MLELAAARRRKSCNFAIRYVSLLAAVTSAVAGLSMADPAFAGDETDYSAPYLTVENGELVTKYPAKKHLNVDTTGDSAVGGDAGPPLTNGWQISVPLGIAIAAAAFLLLLRKKRRNGIR